MTPTHNGQQYRVIYTAQGDLWARDVITAAAGANNGYPYQKTEMDAGTTNQPHVVGGLATVPGAGRHELPPTCDDCEHGFGTGCPMGCN